MLKESSVSAADMVLPLFVLPDANARQSVASMPGVERLGLNHLLPVIEKAQKLGIPAVALFPCTEDAKKTPAGSEAYNSNNLICTTIREIKKRLPEIGIICDVALDPYTSHGHDGLLKDGRILNDETIVALQKQSVTLADAGADMVAPSDMMDGRVGAIRQVLDENSYQDTGILSYAVKYASAFYGPFREAIGSAGSLGNADKKTYQMDSANIREALREVELDINEGADMVMIKPGMPYLDVIREVAVKFPVPVLAYQVSGEYSMLKVAINSGFLSQAALLESILAFKRAGCSAVFTYAAIEVAEMLKKG